MRTRSLALLLLFLPFFAISQEAKTEALNGKELFRNNCKACHNVDKKLVGPALKGVEERRDSAWIYNFIKSSQSMIKAGDETAAALFQEYGEIPMPDQGVNNLEIAAILDYIKEASAVVIPSNPIQRPVEPPITYSDHFRFSNYAFWLPFTIMVIMMVAVFYYLTIYSDIVDKEVEKSV